MINQTSLYIYFANKTFRFLLYTRYIIFVSNQTFSTIQLNINTKRICKHKKK